MNDKYQRVRRAIYILAMIFSLTGLADAIYLTTQHLTGQSVRCAVVTGCSTVLASRYSSVAGIPTAAFGIVGYFTAFSLATLAFYGSVNAGRILRLVVAAMMAATVWLFYLQAVVIHAFCAWCLLSAAMTTLLVLLVLVERSASQRRSV